MSWNKDTMQALKAWIAPSTSHKNHPIDNDRFFDFIHAYWQEHGRVWDEIEAARILKREARRYHSDFNLELLDKKRSEGTLILSFLARREQQSPDQPILDFIT